MKSVIGQSVTRVDAYDKVTGRAAYTDDIAPQNAFHAKVIRSTIANGLVKKFYLEEALKVPGVVKILTCFDSPTFKFPTAGHPWSNDKGHQDVADRQLLNIRVRIYGDEIGAVIAESALAAQQAADLVKVEYEEYPAITSVEQACAKDASVIHEECPDNILKHTAYKVGEPTFDEVVQTEKLEVLTDTYKLQPVQHCHMEVPVSYAYMEKGRITVVSSTQIPHIVKRVVGQATGIPWGKIRVIKPYIGGGFGNKQEVLYEPLNAWLTTQVGGAPVRLELTREETFTCTRVRHPMDITLSTAVKQDGSFVARKFNGYSNQGGYASHGHSIIANASNAFRQLYIQEKVVQADAYTVYTNLTAGGAMRGYGIPQAVFAMEAHIDDIANKIGMDPLKLRKVNMMPHGYVDPLNGITCHSSGLEECIDIGAKYIQWDKKRTKYASQTGNIRKGVGMAIFCYKTATHPISLETASARLILNQDGSAGLQLGATEIGQGADTVFTQMAAQTTGIPVQDIHIQSFQDTDVSPFDTGAYASRQSYVTGMAIKQTALIFKNKLLEYASKMLEMKPKDLDIQSGKIVSKSDNKELLTLEKLAMEAFYSIEDSQHITAESTHQCKENTFAFGAAFADIEVDIPLGKIRVLDVINVHDSGILINPDLAMGQVHGGMSMGLGYGLSEQLLYDKNAKPLNGNLLDYKLPTSLDTPELKVDFVQPQDPTGPYGNKALGEPPVLPIAPAIRNAVLNATGVAINEMPLAPQRLLQHFTQAGLIK